MKNQFYKKAALFAGIVATVAPNALSAADGGGWVWNWNSIIFVSFIAAIVVVTLVSIISAKRTLANVSRQEVDLFDGICENYFRWFTHNKIWVGISILFFLLLVLCIAI